MTEALVSVITTDDMAKLDEEIKETDEYLRQLLAFQTMLNQVMSKSKKEKKEDKKEDKKEKKERKPLMIEIPTFHPVNRIDPNNPFNDRDKLPRKIADFLLSVGPRHYLKIAAAIQVHPEDLLRELNDNNNDLYESETDGWHLTNKAMSYLREGEGDE